MQSREHALSLLSLHIITLESSHKSSLSRHAPLQLLDPPWLSSRRPFIIRCHSLHLSPVSLSSLRSFVNRIFLLSPSPIPPLLPCLSLVLFGHTSCLTASRYTLPLQDPSAKLVNHSSILWPVMKRGSVVTCGWPGPPTWSTSVSGHFHLSWSAAKHANPSSFGLASSRELGAPDLRSRYLVHLDCSHTIRFLQTSTLTPQSSVFPHPMNLSPTSISFFLVPPFSSFINSSLFFSLTHSSLFFSLLLLLRHILLRCVEASGGETRAILMSFLTLVYHRLYIPTRR